MQSSAPNVDTYLLEAPDDRRESLTILRNLYREILVGYHEGIEYGMPYYTKEGAAPLAFASQKNHISLYVRQVAVNAHRDKLTGATFGKGCVRFAKPDKIDFAVVRLLLLQTTNPPV